MSIQADVDRGFKIKADLERLQVELKAIEKRLQAAGLKGEQVPLEDKEREGRQWIAKGTTQQVAVIFTADSIMSAFADDSELHTKLTTMMGAKLKTFFQLAWVNKFRDGKAFRARAKELLEEKKAAEFITACLSRDKDGVPKNRITVAWHEPALKED